jgi:predicted PurR-regulated permease PerM
VVSSLIVIALTALYMSIRPAPLQSGVLRLFPLPRRPQVQLIMHELAQSYLGWLRGLVVGMVVLWVVTYVGLLLVNLPFALVFATITAIAMIVPYYGALVSSIPPVLLALTISPGKAALVAGIYIVSHQVEGNIIGPIVMARAVELHPALVAVGVIAVERAFGPIGLIVAVPILVTIKILVQELWVRRLEETYGGGDPPDDGDGRVDAGTPQAVKA